MTHVIPIEDARGDLVDLLYFCSDYCARQHPLYAGWNGCHESQSCEACCECDEIIKGFDCECRNCTQDDDEQIVDENALTLF